MVEIFIDPHSLPEGISGHFQLLFLLIAYGYVLFFASGLISDGSELLLLIPSVAGIVGSIILPILGAVPDGAIILFSGMGPDAQSQLSVGVGALAGSTIMLLTLPWFLSVWAGRVSIDKDGNLGYKKQPKLIPEEKFSLLKTGVFCSPEISKGGRVMLITSISYLVIQLPAIPIEGESDEQIQDVEYLYALVGFVLCILFFVGYLWYQWHLSQQMDDTQEQKRIYKLREQMAKGMIGLVGYFQHEFQKKAGRISSEKYSSVRLAHSRSKNYSTISSEEVEISHMIRDEKLRKRYLYLLRPYFDKYDADHSGSIDIDEVRLLFRDLNEKMDAAEMESLFKVFDVNGDGVISFDEFVVGTAHYILERIRAGDAVNEDGLEANNEASMSESDNMKDGIVGEEHEDTEKEFSDLSPQERREKIIRKSVFMMSVGTALVLIFSDPMVDVLSALGERSGIPPFYVAFVLAPLASNASELLAACNYASKKTRPTMVVSLSALQGAACMNNTFCLGVFLALIFFNSLMWEFAAETASIIAVQVMIAIVCLKKTHTLLDGFLILCLYPLSLLMVGVLESAGWD